MNNATAPQHNVPPKRSPLLLALIALTVLVVASTLVGWLGIPGTGGPKSVSASNGQVRLPLADLSDGQTHFYRFEGEGGAIPFFAIKGKDKAIHVAFDACDVCYQEKKGYRQEGDQVICKNCNQAFPIAKIGSVSGGCNPSPLKFTQSGAVLEIAVSDLESGRRYFP